MRRRNISVPAGRGVGGGCSGPRLER